MGICGSKSVQQVEADTKVIEVVVQQNASDVIIVPVLITPAIATVATDASGADVVTVAADAVTVASDADAVTVAAAADPVTDPVV